MLVYKYRSDEYFERDITTLLENCIYAAPFNALNDPDEGTCNDAVSDMLNVIDLIFKGDTKHVRNSLQKMLSFKESVGIYSMSKTPFNLDMWINYANSHKGFCIEYELDKLSDEMQFPPKGDINIIDVDYTETFPTITIDDIHDKKAFLTKLYGTKLLKWKKEQEVRIVKDQYGKRAYHPSSLTSIYFGEKSKISLRERIIAELAGYDVKFYVVLISGLSMSAKFIGENKRDIERLNKENFDIITRHNSAVENFQIIYKPEKWTKEEIINFLKLFKEEYSTKQMNVWIYDNAVDKSLLAREPITLSDDEYNSIESHKIAEQYFSGEINFEKHFNF